MIKSVLHSLLAYFVSVFKLPKKVAKMIIQLDKILFWGGNEDQHKLVTVKWEHLEAPVNLVGLGLGNFQVKNKVCY